MSIDKRFKLDEYTKEQAEHIQDRFDKYKAYTGKHCTLTHYVVNVYVPLGHAQRFHEQYKHKHKLQ